MKYRLVIKMEQRHTKAKILAILKAKNPCLLVLESSHPKYNNRILRISHYLTENGWRAVKMYSSSSHIKVKLVRAYEVLRPRHIFTKAELKGDDAILPEKVRR